MNERFERNKDARAAEHSAKHTSKRISRRDVIKRWKAALAVFLAVVLVTQSSHIEAIAQVLADDASSNEVATQQLDQTTTNEGATTEEEAPAEEPVKEETPAPTEETKEEVKEETKEEAKEEPAKDDSKKSDTSTKSDAKKDAEKTDSTKVTAEKDDTKSDSKKDSASTDAKKDTTTDKAPATQEPTEATVKLDLSKSRITYLDKDVAKDQKTLTVPTNEDLKFSVTADNDFEVKSVKTVVDGVESSPLKANENDEYKISADDLTDGMTIKVETEAAPEEEPETPADDQTPSKDETIVDDQTPAEEEDESEETVEGDAKSTDEETTVVEDEATVEEGEPVEEPTPEDPEVLETEDVVADVASPAFEGYAYVGNIIVKVTAGEGILPEGTTVSAYQVNRQDVIQAVANVVEGDGKTEL